MLCSGLTATLVIMINGIVLTHTSPAKVVHKTGATVSSHSALRHFPERNKYFPYFTAENIKASRRIKTWHRLIRELESVIIKLRNVVDKYDLKEEELKALYPGVADCGLNRCGKFRGLLPEKQKVEQFNCKQFKKRNGLKKRTSKLLLDFQGGVQNFYEIFQQLINFEKLPRFKKRGISNGSRLSILNELQTDVKTLNVEIIEIIEIVTVRITKGLNFTPRASASALKRPKSQTDLMINEWRIIQQSKEFLKNWRLTLDKMFKCWKKRKIIRGLQRQF